MEVRTSAKEVLEDLVINGFVDNNAAVGCFTNQLSPILIK